MAKSVKIVVLYLQLFSYSKFVVLKFTVDFMAAVPNAIADLLVF